jgi:pantothenate kinase-related protein Tda10
MDYCKSVLHLESITHPASFMTTAIIAIVSQKGGVGKSTMARALAREAANNGLKVKIADLDTQQGTSVDWLWFLKTSSARTKTRGSCRGALTRWTSNQESGAATVTQHLS